MFFAVQNRNRGFRSSNDGGKNELKKNLLDDLFGPWELSKMPKGCI